MNNTRSRERETQRTIFEIKTSKNAREKVEWKRAKKRNDDKKRIFFACVLVISFAISNFIRLSLCHRTHTINVSTNIYRYTLHKRIAKQSKIVKRQSNVCNLVMRNGTEKEEEGKKL